MSAQLVHVTTRDGVRLDGSVWQAGSATTGHVYCLVHGTGGNFYSSTLFDFLSERLLDRGDSVLCINTRGHDGISTAVTQKGGLRLGATYETVDECRHDLVAWLEWARHKVGPRVGLIGHSLGAVKCLYAAAHEPTLKTESIIAISPPRLSYSCYCASGSAGEFLECYGKAQRLVDEGKPHTLVEVTLPLPMAIAAAGYIEKYGPDERYNFLKFLGGAACPTLLLFGSVEVEKNMAFQGAPAEVAALASRRPSLHLEVVAGADHFYSGVREALWEKLARWLAFSPP